MIHIAVSPAAFEAAARKIAVILLAISTLSTEQRRRSANYARMLVLVPLRGPP